MYDNVDVNQWMLFAYWKKANAQDGKLNNYVKGSIFKFWDISVTYNIIYVCKPMNFVCLLKEN